MMIAHRNPIYSALFLIITLTALAGLFVLLSAPFIAAVHIIVYAGAIMVLFLFVIMLLDVKSNILKEKSFRFSQFVGLLLAVLLLIQLGAVFYSSKSYLTDFNAGAHSLLQTGSTRSVGKLLFTRYLFPFEIASILLLSAIIGTVILSKKKLKQ